MLFFLVVLILLFGDKLYWYFLYKSIILFICFFIFGWFIGLSKFICIKGIKGDIEKLINNIVYICLYLIVFIIFNFEIIFDENIVNRLKGKNI